MNKRSLVWARSSSRFIQSGIGLYPKNEMCKESPASGLPLLYQLLTLRPTLVEFVIGLKSSFPLGTGRGRQRRPLALPLFRAGSSLVPLGIASHELLLPLGHHPSVQRGSSVCEAREYNALVWTISLFLMDFSDHNHIKCQSSKSMWNDTQKESWSLLRRKVAEWGCGGGRLTGWVSRVYDSWSWVVRSSAHWA